MGLQLDRKLDSGRAAPADLTDVEQLIEHGLIDPGGLAELYEQIERGLYRYPAIDAGAFRRKLEAALR